MEFFKKAHVKFIEIRRAGFIFSGSLILIGVISLILHGGPRYGIDFTGGTSLQLKFSQTMTPADLRATLSKVGFPTAEIKHIGMTEENEFIIRVEQKEEGTDSATLIEEALTKEYPNNPYDIRFVQQIGPKIGGELRRAAVMAVFISLVCILIYISWRFEFKFAVGAILALFHDVLITVGVFSLFNKEISLIIVAALLTIVGYSINDTIVVFDRIRENLKVLRRESFHNIINISVNQTLSRTINTSLTTLIAVAVVWIFGGEVVHDFAFALFIGIGIGTYSSIFIASVLVFEWQSRLELRKGKTPVLHKA